MIKPYERLSILVADHDVEFLRTVCSDLRKAGNFDVQTATSSREASTRATSHAPDVLLIEASFGPAEDNDGLECLEALRRNGYKGPAFVCIDKTDSVMLFRAQRAGADDCLFKKDIGRLSQEIQRLLHHHVERILSGEAFDRIANSGFLRTIGMTDSQLGTLSLMARHDYPDDKKLAARLGLSQNSLEVKMHRIRRQLNLQNTRQLVRILTILEMFGRK